MADIQSIAVGEEVPTVPLKRVARVCNMGKVRCQVTQTHVLLSGITLAARMVAEVVFMLAYGVQRKQGTIA